MTKMTRFSSQIEISLTCLTKNDYFKGNIIKFPPK